MPIDSESDHPVPADDGVPFLAIIYELDDGADLRQLTTAFNDTKEQDERHQRLIRLSQEERYRIILSRIELARRIKQRLNVQYPRGDVMEKYDAVMEQACGVKKTQAALYLRLAKHLTEIHQETRAMQAEQEKDGKEPTYPSLAVMEKWHPADPRAKDERQHVQLAAKQARLNYRNMKEEEQREAAMKAHDDAVQQRQRADKAEQELWVAHGKLVESNSEIERLRSELTDTRLELAEAYRELTARIKQPEVSEPTPALPLLLTGPRPRQIKPEIETPDVIELGTDESIAPEQPESIEPENGESLFAMALEATGLAAELTDNKALRAAEYDLELPRIFTGKAPQEEAHRARRAQVAFGRLLERPDCPVDDGTASRVRTLMAAIPKPYEFWTRATGLSFDALVEEWRDKGQL